jgi:YidC/Oxa1 family membrane protein insertase
MSPTLKKFLITSAFASLVVVIGVIVSSGQKPVAQTPASTDAPTAEATEAPAPMTEQAASAEAAKPAASGSQPAQAGAQPAAASAAGTWTARVPAGMTAAAKASDGSLDPAQAPFRVDYSASGAGIDRIVSSEHWTTSDASVSARKGAAMNEADHYTLVEARLLDGFSVPALAMRAVEIDGTFTSLFGAVWGADPTRPGSFMTEIVDASGKPALRISRSFSRVGENTANRYLLTVEHAVENLDGKPHAVRLVQYGPGDLPRDPYSVLEVRRFHFGYLYPPERDPKQDAVTAHGQMYERGTVVEQIDEQNSVLWPNDASKEGNFGLVWYGTTDRYFAFAVHGPDLASKRLQAIEQVQVRHNGLAAPGDEIFAELWGPVTQIDPGARVATTMGVYAGPLDPKILEGVEPYTGLRLGELIVYVMAGCCSWCTFSWLADGLLWFLTFLHDYLVFDWGLAIIALVVVVRLVLHPVQKKSQISMQRFSRAMSAMKPELDALQKKFKDDPARMQQEQMRLFREKGVSPAGCVGGLLPTFAQMPIWMALYAVLFFAFPLRHQAPFFGLFQSFGDWAFLADLSAPDNFLLFPQPLNLYLFSLSSINLLPLLMGVVFWLQQQYMTPQMPNQTEEQIAQQKMMKWMMVLLFPLMMYTVPSGLTLYILTSTCIGIIEGRIIKKQVDAMDLSKPPEQKKRKQDLLGRMYEQALERAKQREQDKKKYKER